MSNPSPSRPASSTASRATTTLPTNAPPPSPSSSNPQSSPTAKTPLRPLFLTVLVATPILALLPPRKLDIYTFSLAGAFVVSAEELAFGQSRRQRTGNTGVMGIMGSAKTDLPVGQTEAEREREGRLIPGFDAGGAGEGRVKGGKDGEGEGVKGLAKKLWMGDERPGWQKRRLEKEREELESGKSYGDIIMDQVREVFPGFGGGRREEDEEGEEKS